MSTNVATRAKYTPNCKQSSRSLSAFAPTSNISAEHKGRGLRALPSGGLKHDAGGEGDDGMNDEQCVYVHDTIFPDRTSAGVSRCRLKSCH
jgi:hypothetical protein